jgi:uncharacterized protein DUF2752
VHALAFAGVAMLLLAVAAALPLDAPPLSLLFCPFRSATGFPCLGCGCTRAFHFAVRGQFAAALSWSPLGTLLALASAAHLLWTALRLAGLPYAPAIEPTRRVHWGAAAALAANWIFVALRDRP